MKKKILDENQEDFIETAETIQTTLISNYCLFNYNYIRENLRGRA